MEKRIKPDSEMFPSFNSDERDEAVPKLWDKNEEQSVSDDSEEEAINIKIFTYRRNQLMRDYNFEANENFKVLHLTSHFKNDLSDMQKS